MSRPLLTASEDTPSDEEYLLPGERRLDEGFDRAARVLARRNVVQHIGQLGSRLRWLRAERSYREVAALSTGLSHTRLQQLESESRPNPTLSVLLALAATYGCGSIEELLGGSPLDPWLLVYRDDRPSSAVPPMSSSRTNAKANR